MIRPFVLAPLFLLSFLTLASPPSWAQAETAEKDLLYVIDCSKSMNRQIEGRRMIDWAKEAIGNAANAIAPDAAVGLRAFAHRIDSADPDKSCQDSELLVPIEPHHALQIASAATALEARGRTPLGYSLRQLESDFEKTQGRQHEIILLSDGGESCGQDPGKILKTLIQKGYQFRMFTVGFNVTPEEKVFLQNLAGQNGGIYLAATGGQVLKEQLTALSASLFPTKTEGASKAASNKERDFSGGIVGGPVNTAGAGGSKTLAGGEDPEGAPLIRTGRRYSVGFQDQKGPQYYKVLLTEGKKVLLRVFPSSDCSRSELSLSYNDPRCQNEGLRLTLRDPGGRTLTSVESTSLTEPVESPQVTIEAEGETLHTVAAEATSGSNPPREAWMLVEESLHATPVSASPSSSTPRKTSYRVTKEESEIFQFGNLFKSRVSEEAKIFEQSLLVVTGVLSLIVILMLETMISTKWSKAHPLTRALGWYEIVASFYSGIVICVKTGLSLINQVDDSWVQSSLYLVFLIISGLGIRAGIFLIRGRSYRQSAWWGFAQLPFLSLVVPGMTIRYICFFLLVCPLYYFIQVGDYLYQGSGLGLHVGADAQVPLKFVSDLKGTGFQLALGINMSAILFLLLLHFAKKIKKQK